MQAKTQWKKRRPQPRAFKRGDMVVCKKTMMQGVITRVVGARWTVAKMPRKAATRPVDERQIRIWDIPPDEPEDAPRKRYLDKRGMGYHVTYTNGVESFIYRDEAHERLWHFSDAPTDALIKHYRGD